MGVSSLEDEDRSQDGHETSHPRADPCKARTHFLCHPTEWVQQEVAVGVAAVDLVNGVAELDIGDGVAVEGHGHAVRERGAELGIGDGVAVEGHGHAVRERGAELGIGDGVAVEGHAVGEGDGEEEDGGRKGEDRHLLSILPES